MSRKKSLTKISPDKYASFGKRLKELRMSQGMTQQAFAKALNIQSSGHISGIESGEKVPSFDMFNALHETFHVNPTWLITGSGPMLLSKKENGFDEHTHHIFSLLESCDDTLKGEVLKFIEEKLVFSRLKHYLGEDTLEKIIGTCTKDDHLVEKLCAGVRKAGKHKK